MSSYLRFDEVPSPGRKTQIFPLEHTFWSRGCLHDIEAFIQDLMDARKTSSSFSSHRGAPVHSASLITVLSVAKDRAPHVGTRNENMCVCNPCIATGAPGKGNPLGWTAPRTGRGRALTSSIVLGMLGTGLRMGSTGNRVR